MKKSLFILLVTNFAIILMLSIISAALGLDKMVGSQGMFMGLFILCFFWGMGGAFISLWMSKWVAKRFMGVQIVPPNTQNERGRWLVQTVHQYAKKAELSKMPEVGFYESPEVNAFATGPSRSNSLVAVSTGLLNRMSREEAEGVIGHEVAHIANGDMVTSTLLTGVMNAFVMFLARIIAFGIDMAMRRGNDRGGGLGFFGYYIVVMVIQSILMIPAMMVINKFSRWREFHADEGGAALAGKEKMIAALERLQATFNVQDEAIAEVQGSMAAMKISGRPSKLAQLFSTHPPLEERIARLRGSA